MPGGATGHTYSNKPAGMTFFTTRYERVKLLRCGSTLKPLVRIFIYSGFKDILEKLQICGHPLITYAKFSEKLTFLNPLCVSGA